MPPFVLLLIQLGLLLIVAVLLGQLAQRFRLPPIAGELMAGVLLGPTILGRLAPAFQLFPPDDVIKDLRNDFLRIGLLLFILLVGLEVNPTLIRQRLRTILPTSALGMLIPFGVGFGAVVLLPGLWRGPLVDQPLALPFIIGVALSISALPVIARILTDLGLIRTEIGGIILSSAIIDDICGWVAFAAVIGAFASAGHGRPWWFVLLFILGSFALALTGGRFLGARLGAWLERRPTYSGLGLGLILATTLLSSAFMEIAGVEPFFGALIVGIALSAVGENLLEPVTRMVRTFFAPLYFGAVATSVDFVANFDLTLVVVTFLIACIGKLVGASLGARIGGCSVRDASAIAAGMNARGAVEVLLATLALNAGLIDRRIFVALVLMALATSILAGTLMQRILGIVPLAKLVRARVPVLQRLDPFGHPVEEIPIGERLTIGRHPANRLALTEDELVSQDHALIRAVDGHFRIEDLHSTNGTLVWRDTRWQEVELDDLSSGDIIVIGTNVFRLATEAA